VELGPPPYFGKAQSQGNHAWRKFQTMNLILKIKEKIAAREEFYKVELNTIQNEKFKNKNNYFTGGASGFRFG